MIMDDRMQYTFEKKISKSIIKILKCVQKNTEQRVFVYTIFVTSGKNLLALVRIFWDPFGSESI